MNVFRLLVLAIAAIALLYVFYSLVQFFFLAKNPIPLLENNLEGAKLKEGKSVFSEILFSQGTSIAAKNFDSDTRSVSFECNNPRICCNKDDDCGLIEWDERRIFFNSGKTMITATRCSFSENLYACKIYFGDAPAQLAFKRLSAKKEIDAGKEPVEIEAEIINSGNQPMIFGQVNIDVYQKVLENGKVQKKFLSQASKIMPLNRLLQGEVSKIQIPIDAADGDYQIELLVSGQNSGSDKNTVYMKITGTESCIAEACETQFLGDLCIASCYCKNCMFGSSCEEAIKARSPLELGLGQGTEISGLTAGIKGSNEIEFVLKNENCN